ncbi:peptidoglycan endopeptidase LytF [Lachnospiraceae bacterium]|nr:peptidoglycan endopeptidase LytF [Lachnospiraceae bacterium]
MKKFGTRLLSVAIASSLIVTPVMAAPTVDELNKEVSDLKENKAEKQSEVNSLQKELTDIMTKLGELEEDLVQKGEEILQAQDDLVAAEAKEREQYEAMKIRIKYMYEEGDTTALESLVTAENFSDLLNKAEYVQNVHTYDREQLKEYAETKQQIADLKAGLEEDKAKLESLQDEYEAKEGELNTMIETKSAEVADLDQQIQAAAEAVAKAVEEQRRKEEEERRRAEEARQAQIAEANNNRNNGGGNRGDSTQNTSNNANTGNNNNSGNNNSGNGGYTGTGNASVGQTIVAAARSQIGVPYVWGGTTPGSGLDCSGLTQYCHRVAGISIPRTSGPQGGGGKAVSSPMPGDIVCYPGHVGIYIGGGQMIHAPEPGDFVKVASVYGSPWYRRYW